MMQILSTMSKTEEIKIDESYGFMDIPKTPAKLTQLPSGSVTGQWALDLRFAPICFANDLEKDAAFSSWPRTVRALFTPSYFGGPMKQIARNYFNLVLMVDPLEPVAQSWIRLAEAFLINKLPIRIGFLMTPHEKAPETSKMLARIFSFVSAIDSDKAQQMLKKNNQRGLPITESKHNPTVLALSLLTDVFGIISREEKANSSYKVTEEEISGFFKSQFAKEFDKDILESVIKGDKEIPSLIRQQEFFFSSGISDLATEALIGESDNKFYEPMLLANGHLINVRQVSKFGGFEDTILAMVMDYTNMIQISHLQSRFSDSDSIEDLQKKNKFLISRISARVLATREKPIYLSLASREWTPVTNNIHYMMRGDEMNKIRPVTVWMVLGSFDPTAESSLSLAEKKRNIELAKSAIDYLTHNADHAVRVGFLLNPSSRAKSEPASWSEAGFLDRVLVSIGRPGVTGSEPLSRTPFTIMAAKNFLKKVAKLASSLAEGDTDRKSLADFAVSVSILSSRANFPKSQGLELAPYQEVLASSQLSEFLAKQAQFSKVQLKLLPGQSAVVVNGKVYSLSKPLESFQRQDFKLAESMTLEHSMSSGVANSLAKMTFQVSGQDANIEAKNEVHWQLMSILQAHQAHAPSLSEDSSVRYHIS
ncbi:UDP-glucose:glycoprotein glucosyltransferase 2 [Cichlidogyrus casuarinus]|uniref:UDP-glucose:glycoprotein glucosyltransferase 2 n=1 Tax=Cichlidogyrus casuarinus TaxID=1844966 RepID=A0ABD2PWU7_9PLAT